MHLGNLFQGRPDKLALLATLKFGTLWCHSQQKSFGIEQTLVNCQLEINLPEES